MTGPLYEILNFREGILLFYALLIGFLFGYTLYRAGFYNSKKLAGVFYLYDFSVYKVIFTAIVTAGFLLFLSSKIGLIEFSLLKFHSSYLVSAAIGGFVFGVGFIFGGFCPGTSIVGAVKGNVDAMAFIGGVFGGIFIWDILYPYIFKGLNHLGHIKEKTLMDAWGVSYFILLIGALIVVLITFPIVSKIEKKHK